MVADLGPGSTASALLLCMTDCPDSAASFPACRLAAAVSDLQSRLPLAPRSAYPECRHCRAGGVLGPDYPPVPSPAPCSPLVLAKIPRVVP